VIIPTFNRASLVSGAINSVLGQSYRDFELIIIDDGSTDDTERAVRRYGNRILYHRQTNRGVAAARNAGIEVSRGEYLCFLDSDDLWKAEKLQVQVAFADAHPGYALIATEISPFDRHGAVAGRAKSRMYRIANGMVAEQLLFANWIQTSTVLVRAHCLKEVGGFDEEVGNFGEDWLAWMRMASRYPIYFLPQPLVLYRVHEETLTSHQPEAQYQGLMLILARLGSLPQFQAKPELLKVAKYRIALGRARRDLRSGAYCLALEKLRTACELWRLPIRAAVLLFRVKFATMLSRWRAEMRLAR
jgi:glycosyltransferase involved in cell wall biosynthesis